MKSVGILFMLVLCGVFTSCTYAQSERVGRALSGIDCRPEKLDTAGRCVAAK